MDSKTYAVMLFGAGHSVLPWRASREREYIRTDANEHPAPPSLPRTLYSIATFILPAILPFTGVFIQPVNRKLFKKAETLSLKNLDVPEEENRRNAEGVKALLEKWTWLHKIRTGITGVGVVCLAWAIFEGESVV